MYQRKFWGYANNGRNLKTFFISGSSGLVNQDLQKILARRIKLLTARVSIQFILLQRQKMKDIWFHYPEYIPRCDNLWWHRCNIIWIPGVLKRIWQDNITKIFNDTQTRCMGHIMQSSQSIQDYEITERVASQSSEYERQRGQEAPLVEDLILID